MLHRKGSEALDSPEKVSEFETWSIKGYSEFRYIVAVSKISTINFGVEYSL